MVQSYSLVLVTTATGILLINRAKPPYRGLWNGVGGKIEPHEAPVTGARREVAEETGLTLTEAAFHPAGLAHWFVNGSLHGDLYLFTATTDAEFAQPRMTREGVLAAWPLEWVTAPDNLGLVPDLHELGPRMLNGENHRYNIRFTGNAFDGLDDLGNRND